MFIIEKQYEQFPLTRPNNVVLSKILNETSFYFVYKLRTEFIHSS